jgi:hypothetical protein
MEEIRNMCRIITWKLKEKRGECSLYVEEVQRCSGEM